MEQLLLHLVGDYLTQTDWMAREKTKRLWAALVHAFVYSLPFVFVFNLTWLAWGVILGSHWVIDRFRLARYVVFAKNWITDRSLRWTDCQLTGYPSSTPMWLSVWLMIIADNTLHLSINYASLRWLN